MANPNKYLGETSLAEVFTKKNLRKIANDYASPADPNKPATNKELKALHKGFVKNARQHVETFHSLLVQASIARAKGRDHFIDTTDKKRYPSLKAVEESKLTLDDVVTQLTAHHDDAVHALYNLALHKMTRSRDANGLKRLYNVRPEFANFLRAAVNDRRFAFLQINNLPRIQVLTPDTEALLNTAIGGIAAGGLIRGTKLRTLFSIYARLNGLTYLAVGPDVNNAGYNPGLISHNINDSRKSEVWNNFKPGFVGFDDLLVQTVAGSLIARDHIYTERGVKKTANLAAYLGVNTDGTVVTAAIPNRRIPVLLNSLIVRNTDAQIVIPKKTAFNQADIDAAVTRFKSVADDSDNRFHNIIKAASLEIFGSEGKKINGEKIRGNIGLLNNSELCKATSTITLTPSTNEEARYLLSSWFNDYRKFTAAKNRATRLSTAKSTNAVTDFLALSARNSAAQSRLSATQQAAVNANATALAAGPVITATAVPNLGGGL